MNFIEFESAQKLRGGFYTQPAISAFLARWIKSVQPKSVLEPSCGDGAFLEAIDEVGIESLTKIVACEIDHEEAGKANVRTGLPVTVHRTDFLRWYLFVAQFEEGFDAVVGNPPFIRYQYLPAEQQRLAEKIFGQLDLPFTKHTNAWVPFVLASIRLLKAGGRLAMVVPSEIFHIPHAQSLRRYLAAQCSKILIVDPEELWFENTLQGTVLLLAEKRRDDRDKRLGVAIVPVSSRDALSHDPEDYYRKAEYANGETIEGKWMRVFLSQRERVLVSELKSHHDVKKFGDIASVDVGIVTGANKFFLVPDTIVSEYALDRWAHPMFGRSDHVKGLIYDSADHEMNKKLGLPTNFLWFNEEVLEQLPVNVRSYLELGHSQMLHTRFKCRTRKPWYRVPSVFTAPVAMMKRAHHYPRLVLNSANAYTTDTAYRIRPLKTTHEALVFGFVNSLTCLCAEMEGRHYGGGVLELVPSEIERLLIPSISVANADLKVADERFRKLRNDSEFLRSQDLIVLGQLGLSKSDQVTLHNAWIKMRDRRHRVPKPDTAQTATRVQ